METTGAFDYSLMVSRAKKTNDVSKERKTTDVCEASLTGVLHFHNQHKSLELETNIQL